METELSALRRRAHLDPLTGLPDQQALPLPGFDEPMTRQWATQVERGRKGVVAL